MKTTRPGFHQHLLEFRRYTNQSMCDITYIKWYLLETKELGHRDGGFFIHVICFNLHIRQWHQLLLQDGWCFKWCRCKCLFLVSIQRDYQRPVTNVWTWRRNQKQVAGLMSKHLQCFTRRSLVKTLGRWYYEHNIIYYRIIYIYFFFKKKEQLTVNRIYSS